MSSRQRSIIRHPHDYTGAQVENGARVEGSGANRQSITVEYAYASNNYGGASRSQRASYAASRSTPPRSGSPTERPAHRVRNSLHKAPPSSTQTVRKYSKEPAANLEATTTVSSDPEPAVIDYQDNMLQSPVQSSAPPRPSRANTETLQDLYTPDVAAFSESHMSTVYDRRASLPAIPANEDEAFVADMNEALPPIDPFGPGGHRSRSTTQSKPKKGGMLSFMSGMLRHIFLAFC